MGPRSLLAVLGLALVVNVCWAGDAGHDWTDEARRSFVEELRKASPSVALTERFSPQIDDPTYLEEDLAENLFEGAAARVHRELRGQLSEDGSPIHLGLLAIRYSSADEAREMETLLRTRAPVGAFKSGKLLIRFTTARRDREVLVAYSETPLSPQVEAVFRSLRGDSGPAASER